MVDHGARSGFRHAKSVHLWFLFAMLGLYVLMPGARLLVRDGDAKPSQYFTAGVPAAATCLSVVGMAALGHSQVLFVSYTPLLLVYLAGGYLLYRDRPPFTAAALWSAAAVCVGGIMLVVRFLEPQVPVPHKSPPYKRSAHRCH